MHPFHPEYILTAFIQIVPFIGVTLLMMAGTVLFGGLIGILLAKAKMNRRMVPRAMPLFTYILQGVFHRSLCCFWYTMESRYS